MSGASRHEPCCGQCGWWFTGKPEGQRLLVGFWPLKRGIAPLVIAPPFLKPRLFRPPKDGGMIKLAHLGETGDV